ncbi:MAG TPA: TatD family hydrolase [Verrucomicrobiae bacterium]|jgi:TatD DNase family protein|nr:TatD family hydrolase [Verrucomicrobiae bacterium]
MAHFYDTHAHLGFPDFEDDLDDVVARAAAAGIVKMISIGTDLATSEKAIGLAEKYPAVYAAVGWHPNDLADAPPDVRDGLRALARHPKVVALGETGLDFYRQKDPAAQARQAEVFQQQLELAAELDLGCIIHTRDSFAPTLAQMTPFAGKIRAVFHCFSQDVAALRQVLSLGWLVSFTGILTFKNAQSVRDCLAAVPAGGFMLETDCPFLAPVPFRGKRCEPAYVQHTAAVAAQVKGCSLDNISAMTCATAEKFFPKLHGRLALS